MSASPQAPGKAARLAESKDMDPVAGTVDLEIPAEVLWQAFTQGRLWPRWNACMFWVGNGDLVQGRQLLWVFEPLRWFLVYKFPAIATIDEVSSEEDPETGRVTRKVTWEVVALLGFYARHSYHVEDLGEGRCRFGSWEKARGLSFRLTRRFWLAHFTFVKDESLAGAQALEAVYQAHGELSAKTIPRRRSWWASLRAFVVAWTLIVAVALGGWFWASYVRLSEEELAPGVHVLRGGGGNSVVLEDGEAVLLIDPKFDPAARSLKRWIRGHVDAPVQAIVNTHYHYDHTRGNVYYPKAAIWAHQAVPGFMDADEPEFWGAHEGAVPNLLVEGEPKGRPKTMFVGQTPVELHVPERAHTAGDLWINLPRQQIVITGDIVVIDYYPFMDLSEGGRGTDVPGEIRTIRRWIERYPNATFIPGHGPPATAMDLADHADYLEFLWQSVEQAIADGLSEDEAVKAIDLSSFGRKVLPSIQFRLELEWATAANNVRWVYRLQTLEASTD